MLTLSRLEELIKVHATNKYQELKTVKQPDSVRDFIIMSILGITSCANLEQVGRIDLSSCY